MLASLVLTSQPSAASSVAIASCGPADSGAIASCSWPRLRDVSSPMMSGRVASVCPNLQKTDHTARAPHSNKALATECTAHAHLADRHTAALRLCTTRATAHCGAWCTHTPGPRRESSARRVAPSSSATFTFAKASSTSATRPATASGCARTRYDRAPPSLVREVWMFIERCRPHLVLKASIDGFWVICAQHCSLIQVATLESSRHHAVWRGYPRERGGISSDELSWSRPCTDVKTGRHCANEPRRHACGGALGRICSATA